MKFKNNHNACVFNRSKWFINFLLACTDLHLSILLPLIEYCSKYYYIPLNLYRESKYTVHLCYYIHWSFAEVLNNHHHLVFSFYWVYICLSYILWCHLFRDTSLKSFWSVSDVTQSSSPASPSNSHQSPVHLSPQLSSLATYSLMSPWAAL